MDSPDWCFFRQGFTGHKNRMKLRIRFYDNEWKRPAFLEVKRRVSEVIRKERAMISREGVREILTSGWPAQPYYADCAHLLHGKRRQDVNEDFWGFANTSRAEATIYVSYFREIWESPEDEELRVTFDRRIRGSRYDGSGRLEVPKRGWQPYMPPYLTPFPADGVILELKFDERPPKWMVDLVRIFNLQQTPVCKYCALAVLPLLVSMMMVAMANSLIVAFGLLGVFGVVRFRNVLKDTRDTSFILWAIMEGMALGTRRFSTAFLAFLGIALAFVCLRFVSFGTRARYDAVLTLRVTGDVASGLAALKQVLKRHATRVDLTGDRRSTAEGTDLSYRLLLRDTARSADLQSELAGTYQFENVSVYLHDDEAEI